MRGRALVQVAQRVEDLDRAVAFYRDVLGLRLIERFDPPGIAAFDLGTTRLVLGPDHYSSSLFLEVEDLDACHAELLEAGVEFERPPVAIHTDEVGHFGLPGTAERMAFLWDSERNLVALVERTEPVDADTAIRSLLERERRAWDEQDAEALVGLFHPDMVWPWRSDPTVHDPATWVLELGRYDRVRWQRSWQDLFDSHELVRNDRAVEKVVVSTEGDGGFAVVDIDTVWRNRVTGDDDAWTGRTCTVFSRTPAGWKITMQTGVLDHG